MALQKQNVNISFAKGLDTKSDPKQIPIGNFLSLENSIFDKGGLLQKRNGFQQLGSLPNDTSTYLTTLNNNLIAVGESISAYNSNTETWVSCGTYQPMEISTLPLVRNNVNQIQSDAAIASNGLICTVYTEVNGAGTFYKYTVADSSTGQAIIAPSLIPVGSGTVTGSPRVFCLGNYFILVFTNVISATSHLQYIAINVNNPTIMTANTDIASSYISAATLSWDGIVSDNNLYVAYNTTTGGQAVKVVYLTQHLTLVSAVTFSGRTATMMSLSADPSTMYVYVSFYDSASSTGYALIVDKLLNTILTPTEWAASGTFLNITSAAQNGVLMIFYEVSHNYSYDSSIPTHFVSAVTMTVGGTVGTPIISIRSLGLSSKAFIQNGNIFYLGAYQSPSQNTYFLVNATTSTSASPQIVAKIAYENGGGYLPLGLPNVSLYNSEFYIPYLYKDLIEALSTTANPQQTTTGGIYAQTGVNLASFAFTLANIDSVSIGNDLHLSGGFLWMYDGVNPVEHNFFLWPDSIEVAGSGTSGSMTAQQYYYQVTYEWGDNQGNIFRSAPSIPVTVTLTSDTSVSIHIPTLRLTYKDGANPVKVVIYRWSVAQQSYYQVTSIALPTLNDTTIDSITFTDTLADSSILGNNLIYTTGGVVEDVNGPASNVFTLFDTRLWLVDAEDPNLLWYSKQVIESTPIEMSDLFTVYIAPNTGVQNATGPITALSPMDDKLIIFKRDAIYYINGTGPDNTGANSQYSQPIFITSTVGCSNQQSIVLMPDGLMFQSDKGIWLLGRNLQTIYIGAPVEAYNASLVESAVSIPATNQVRFTLNSGITLMYDYYYSQWGTFSNIPALASTIYENLHTFVNHFGELYQEQPGVYLDGTSPVLMNFTTGWLNLAGIQGYERIYDFYLLGQYYSPHKLAIGVAYDYNSSPSQQSIISPLNYNAPWGGDSTWGASTPWGGTPSLEEWRVHTARQTCSALQISLQEIFDSTYNVQAGVGLTLSNINMRLGIKKGARPIPSSRAVG